MTSENKNQAPVHVPAIVTDAATLRRIIKEAVDDALEARAPAADAPSEWMDTKGVAALFGVDQRSVQRMAKRGTLKGQRLGTKIWRFKRSDVLGLLNQGAA